MASHLNKICSKPHYSRSAVEGEIIMKRMLSHDDNIGAQTVFIVGKPGSCKTSITCAIAENKIHHNPKDRIYWRSALHSPLQFFMLPKWHILVEKESGVRFFDRNDNLKDKTENFIRNGHLTYFDGFDDLYRKSKPGVCNAVFFKDLHMKNVDSDCGVLQWFRFIRYLVSFKQWCHVFIDEYQELVKIYRRGQLFHEIDEHSNDLTSARKSKIPIVVNAQQPEQIDFRIKPGMMIVIQLYGARPMYNSPITKKALSSLRRPDESYGAEGWVSESLHFGKIIFRKVYRPNPKYNIIADIVSDKEKTKVCEYCNRIYCYSRKDQQYCSDSCKVQACNKRKKGEIANQELNIEDGEQSINSFQLNTDTADGSTTEVITDENV